MTSGTEDRHGQSVRELLQTRSTPKGAPLFAQDDTHERTALDQGARQLAQAEEQLANLEAIDSRIDRPYTSRP